MTLKTLIVDDEALARSRMRTLLRDCTSPAADVVAEASQGAEAQRHLAALALDLVLLDVHMPGVDGLELARTLRGRYGDDIVLVAVTGHPATDRRVADAFVVVDHYLQKPIDLEALRKVLPPLHA